MPRFRAEPVTPARDLAEGVVASLNHARLRYIEGLVILKSGFKAAAVIKRGCRLGRWSRARLFASEVRPKL
jgi:hypothetical protein